MVHDTILFNEKKVASEKSLDATARVPVML